MKIGVWYHCVISGLRIPSRQNAIDMLSEQMIALDQSGLANAADEIHVGVNGCDSDALTVCAFTPQKAILHVHHNGQTEISTLTAMQNWLKPEWGVLYHHIKGVQHDPRSGFSNWRRNMERICVYGWTDCVRLLQLGIDTCGAHWFTPLNGALPGQRYWAGNFWWAKSEYLLTLPTLCADTHENRYEAESWIGTSPRNPRIQDLWRKMPLG